MTVALDAGTYEVLRARLANQAAELATRAQQLNTDRLAVFGGTEMRLIGAERIRTENNCVPRDIVSVNGLMLFGYNVFIGLKPETAVADVFSLHRFTRDGDAFRFDPDTLPGLLDDPRFERDFAEMYRYYRETRLAQLRRIDGKLLAVFQTGPSDIRVLRWLADGEVSYEDSRGERDHVLPPAHDFEWVETTRDDHVLGRHPHVSIQNEVFIETVGGDLTVKLENNTETGEGIYAEPVDEPLQSLADADVHYARIGALILLKIRPYKETTWRYLVFNTRTKGVVRLDGIGQACQRLPEDQGIIFPGGYYLATGTAKTFDTDVTELQFERSVRSGNGEDVLYVFHAAGRYLLLPYNVIRKEVGTPISCHGWSLFDDGTLVVFRAVSDEPTRVHTMQVWQTPYVTEEATTVGSGPLDRVGNADLVRGISDCLSVARMVDEMAPSTEVFEALIAACDRTFDHYHWLGEQELRDLRTPLAEVRATAEQVLDEFEGVQALTAQAATALSDASAGIASLIRKVRGEAPKSADEWVAQLAELRRSQGHLVTLREMRYVDTARIDLLTGELSTELDSAAQRAVAFLSGADAFSAYHAEVEKLLALGTEIKTVAEARPVQERLDAQAEGLEMLTQVVSSLEIADATVRTGILERVGAVLGGINRARATVDGRRRSLSAAEGRASFAAEFALLGQAITAALAVADTPTRCDDQLGRLMVQLENLESRFGEFDDFLAEIGAKRTDVYEAFSARKQALLDSRARRADRLVESASRILTTVQRRAGALASLDEVNTYFAGDPMVAKLRSVVDDLRSLGDQVRAEELAGRIKAARQEAGRALRDRLDLYADGGASIRLGRHSFAVHTQAMDLTLVPSGDGMAVGITGTDFRDLVRDPAFEATRPFWDQLLVSESAEVYRAEFLATSVRSADELRQAVESRYDEGYERGVHDHDALKIFEAVQRLAAGAGTLRYPPRARAAAALFWVYGASEESRSVWSRRALSLVRARDAFTPSGDGRANGPFARAASPEPSVPGPPGGTLASGSPPGRVGATQVPGGVGGFVGALAAELLGEIGDFLRDNGLSLDDPLAGEYLVAELAGTPFGFVTSAAARTLVDRFRRTLSVQAKRDLDDDLKALDSLADRYQLVEAWLTAYLTSVRESSDELAEAVAIELCRDVPRHDSSASLEATVDGLLGTHPRVRGGRLTFRLDELLARTRGFQTERVPAFRRYQKQRTELLAAERRRLRFDEYRPKVMTAFVRNQLLDEVYLPLIGDNLAKQLGTAGETKRTDQMGLLLLISPPGYGKTTLMEYVADRLGLVFVKVNGPALGHTVTSVDPAEAPNATARQEIEKISFALEMGNNVLLYLDDIQHTSPELLQKFISLCDAQRRMEGVWNGQSKTYDLRGKRFAVCMAGNPYTESGQRFRIPDMLANRADVWNLGDVLTGRDELFALSFVENALTSNPVLAPLSTRDREDVPRLVRLARGDEGVRPDQLSHPYSSVELDQVLSVLRKLLNARRVILATNETYIASAAQSDSSRTEPPFQLQGSYRNINKIAEKIVPAMNDRELDAVINDHYLAEAQTLTTGAEANLLKLAELRGTLTDTQAARWAEVKAAYVRDRALGGGTDDPVSRAVGAVGLLADRVDSVASAIRGLDS
jgi:hypothetical protein